MNIAFLRFIGLEEGTTRPIVEEGKEVSRTARIRVCLHCARAALYLLEFIRP